MSKPPEVLPPTPGGVELSPVPNLTLSAAAAWCVHTLDLPITLRYLQRSADARQLRVHMIGRDRLVSTEELYRFVLTRPARKADVRTGTTR